MNKSNKPPKSGLSRREFFKNASFAAGGGMLLGSLPAGASAYAASSETLRVGVVGCGGRGQPGPSGR
jgi:myo-inositol 2-dehydrogenase / D-chiro-inositol 1-dehydrogenase